MLGNALHCRKHGKIRRNEQLTDRVCKASFAMLGNALHCRKHGKMQRTEQLIGFARPHLLCSGMLCTAESMVKYREMNN